MPVCAHRGTRERSAEERLTERQQARLEKTINADERHLEVLVAWRCAQQLQQA